MAFICPQCTKGAVVIKAAIELPPDSRSDEITLQVVACAVCDFSGVAVYQESRRGALGSESWDHYGYRANEKVVNELSRAIRSCPDTRDARCKCATHRRLAGTDRYGRWRVPPEIESGAVFAMRMA